MEGSLKKHKRTVTLTGYQVTVTFADRADSTDITTEISYLEAENISAVYRHVLSTYPPMWLEHLADDNRVKMEWIGYESLDADTLEMFFSDAYGSVFKSADDDYTTKYSVDVKEWEYPTFQVIS